MPKEYKHYLKHQILQYYYNKIKASGSLESDVDNFYNTFLPIYFRADEQYGIEKEAHVGGKDSGQRADFAIRYINNSTERVVVLLKDKNSSFASSDVRWRDALTQVVDYAKASRAKHPDEDYIIYLTVNIGTYIRFYQLNPRDYDATNFAPAGGQLFELAADEEAVHANFEKLKEYTRH